MSRVARVGAVVISLTLALAGSELIVRWMDGYALLSGPLRSVRVEVAPVTPPDERSDRRVALSLPLAPGVDAAWYDTDPEPIPRFPVDPELLERLERYPNDPIGSMLVWNPIYVRAQLCQDSRLGSLGILDEFYMFDPVEDSPYPIYRHLPNASVPGWFTSNAFGWRGPPLTLRKPADVIRIAFVGASTTIAVHGYENSYPEHLGHWLNLWAQAEGLPVRFDVINAGRTGIDSNSIQAIVRQEIVPVDPDLVIYYEGANQFAPGKLMRMPATLAAKPTATFRQRSWVQDYLALAGRVLTAYDRLVGHNGHEPPKPSYPIVWPRDVDEDDPDVTQKPLPMDLDAVVDNLDRMRVALEANGAELGVSSFLWMVYPGMQLDLSKDLTLYRYLNDTYWPATYAHLRRTADFQNRLFAAYAAHHGLPFLDLARDFPMDPSLFGDAIHLMPEGLRLQAWIYLQQLVPLIRDRIGSGRWPRALSHSVVADPSRYSPRLMSRKDIVSACPRVTQPSSPLE